MSVRAPNLIAFLSTGQRRNSRSARFQYLPSLPPLGSRIRQWPRRWVSQGALGLLVFAAVAVQSRCHGADSNIVINPPIGPYVNLQASDFSGTSSFTSTDRVVLTPYFYWYDVYSGAHIIDFDGTDALTDHPATLT